MSFDRNDKRGGHTPAGKSSSGRTSFAKSGESHSNSGRFGHASGDKTANHSAYGKPSAQGERKGPYGRPAPRSGMSTDGSKPSSSRPAYGRPAVTGERKGPYGRPAPRSSAPVDGNRPASARPVYGRPAVQGERRGPYGRPAPANSTNREATAVHTDGLPARRIALKVLREVLENDAYASLALDKNLSGCGLGHTDMRLVTRLVYDTLENLLKLDYALHQFMARPDTDPKLMNVLRLGACQILLEERIPDSAATNTSVTLCKELGLEGLAGVCNGILRNLIRGKEELQWPDEEAEPLKAASIRYSVPEWLVETLRNDWGRETADAIMAFSGHDSYTSIRPNLTAYDDESFEKLLAKKVWHCEKGAAPHSWRVTDVADLGKDSDFAGGHFSIQGEGSMLVCEAVGVKRGMQVLDACAAPGGKACLLAEMMQNTGRVQAWELHQHRTDLIAAQVKRLKLENVRPMCRDALKLREDAVRTMDAVLLDAPCSGLGVMADKPDVRLHVTPESVKELTELQKNLLDTVCQYVKPGGILVYSTCSILKDENERQAESFLARHPEFEAVSLPETIPAQFRQYEQLGLQLMPQRDHTGGFYMIRMRRKRV